jgi:hypothetical protein
MGNILATPHAANYRRTLSGSNRAKAIQNLDNETIDLAYVLYIYFILVLCAIAVIYLYSIKVEGVPRFKGDKMLSSQENWWVRFINWLQETPADRRCALMSSYPTISIPVENQPSTTQMNSLCSLNENGLSAESDCLQ